MYCRVVWTLEKIKKLYFSANKALGTLKEKINFSFGVDIKDIKVEEPVWQARSAELRVSFFAYHWRVLVLLSFYLFLSYVSSLDILLTLILLKYNFSRIDTCMNIIPIYVDNYNEKKAPNNSLQVGTKKKERYRTRTSNETYVVLVEYARTNYYVPVVNCT